MWTSVVSLPYRIGILACLIAAAWCSGWWFGMTHEQGKWLLADAARAKAEEASIVARIQSNTALALHQQDTNRAITKAHDEELSPVLAAIAADRVHIGPALCGGTSAPSKTESASSSNGPDPVASGIRDAAKRDLAALKAEVAMSLAAGRSCQAFARENGLDQ